MGLTPEASVEIDDLIMADVVELRAPNLVRALVLHRPERDWRPGAEVEIANRLQRVHQPLVVELAPRTAQSLHQYPGRQVTLQRNIIRLLSREVFRQRRLVFENGGGGPLH